MKFILHNCSEQERLKYLQIFNEKYDYPQEYNKSFIVSQKVYDIYKLKPSRCLILDIHTLENLGEVIPCDLLVYSNVANPLKRFQKKSCRYFGYYEYQNYDDKELLKFSFEHYKKLDVIENNIFIVSPFFDYKNIEVPKKYDGRKKFYKEANRHFDRLHEHFDTLLYFQGNRPDTNNRLIPESFYYKKEIEIIPNGIQDSVILRYNDILENGLKTYQLTDDDRIISAFLD